MVSLSESLLHQIEQFCRKHRVRRLSAFGSYVRGKMKPESDIDLLVEFEPDVRIGFLALSRMQRELSMIFERDVDLVPRKGLKPTIREEVLKEEVVLYAS